MKIGEELLVTGDELGIHALIRFDPISDLEARRDEVIPITSIDLGVIIECVRN
jgi:hypothetical protein